MKLPKSPTFPGGALGKIAGATNASAKAVEKMRAMYPLHLREENGSWVLEHRGYPPDSMRPVWTGKACLFYGDGGIDLTFTGATPDLISGSHICLYTGYDTQYPAPSGGTKISGRWSWNASDPGKPYYAWRVAEWNEAAQSYILIGSTAGDIRAPIPLTDDEYKIIAQGGAETADGMDADYARAHEVET